jgi:TRAP-type C4-dicarboxylate transport system substrate-binding protein
VRTCAAPLALLLLTLAAIAGCRTRDGTRVLKLAHGLDVSHPVHVAMVHMADRLLETSGGRMRVEIHPSGQLGEERELTTSISGGCWTARSATISSWPESDTT